MAFRSSRHANCKSSLRRAIRIGLGPSGPGELPDVVVGPSYASDPGAFLVMKIQPLGDRVVVERETAQEKTAGGIVLPDTAKDKPQQGLVLAVGDGRVTKDGTRRPLQVKTGDKVLFTSYAGDEFKLDGDKKVLLMREDDILAVVEA